MTAKTVASIDDIVFPPSKNVENGIVGATKVTFSDFREGTIYTPNGDYTCLACLTTETHTTDKAGVCNSDGRCSATEDNSFCYVQLPYMGCDCTTCIGTSAEIDGTVEFCV